MTKRLQNVLITLLAQGQTNWSLLTLTLAHSVARRVIRFSFRSGIKCRYFVQMTGILLKLDYSPMVHQFKIINLTTVPLFCLKLLGRRGKIKLSIMFTVRSSNRYKSSANENGSKMHVTVWTRWMAALQVYLHWLDHIPFEVETEMMVKLVDQIFFLKFFFLRPVEVSNSRLFYR